MKENKSKWSKIVHNFLDSGLEVIKLHETIRPENAVISLKHYLDGKGFPIAYAKRENYIYMYRTDCTTVSIDEAIEGKYLDNGSFTSIAYPFGGTTVRYSDHTIANIIKQN